MVNDLDLVAVRIAEVARTRAVPVRARQRVERDAAVLEKRRPIGPRRLPISRSARDDRVGSRRLRHLRIDAVSRLVTRLSER